MLYPLREVSQLTAFICWDYIAPLNEKKKLLHQGAVSVSIIL